jgi:diguanylate cyclase
MILPLTISKPAAFHERATAEQMLQGLLLGIGLSLLIYSLAQWLSLREPLYLKYSILTAGSLMFSVLLFGIGTQYLWTNNLWMERHVGVLSALCASVGSFLFNEQSLRGPGTSLWFRRVMLGGAALGCILAVIFALDIFDTTIMTSIISVIGPIPALLSIPGALDRARQRDPVGAALLFAWLAYFATTAVLIGVIAGKLPVNFWTLHSFEFGATIDMLAFMYVLSLRTKAVRQAATRASQERDIMRSLAHTDPLTGLANRRSLSESLESALTRSTPDNQLAVYLIDVDGFKPVNDRFGHDAGDELLIGIARRLKEHVRSSDIVARLGGDEFVVLASGLRLAQQAHELGTNLIEVFNEPFQLKQGTAYIGLTIGYALAPTDAQEASAVLHLADAAMYLGKQDGKRCLRRAATPFSPSRFMLTQPT